MSYLSRRRFESFRSHRAGFLSLIVLSIFFFLSLFAELFCNDRPILIQYRGKIYTPFLVSYPSSEFGALGEFEAHYSESVFKKRIEKDGWILWAPIRFNSNTVDFELKVPAPSPPDSQHLLGTDDRGRDVFARLVYGFRLSLTFGLLLGIFCVFLGFSLGAVVYEGTYIDLIFQRVIEIGSSIPETFLLMILSSLFKPSFFLLLGIMSVMGWIPIAAYVRGDILRLRHLDFVKSAEMLGASKFYIIRNHLLPHALTPVLSYLPLRISNAITSLAILDFLGLGLPNPSPSLGELFLQGKAHLDSWWILVSVFLTLALSVLLLHTLSEGIRQALDPKV